MILYFKVNIIEFCVFGRIKVFLKINFGYEWIGYIIDKIDKGNNKNIVLVKFS